MSSDGKKTSPAQLRRQWAAVRKMLLPIWEGTRLRKYTSNTAKCRKAVICMLCHYNIMNACFSFHSIENAIKILQQPLWSRIDCSSLCFLHQLVEVPAKDDLLPVGKRDNKKALPSKAISPQLFLLRLSLNLT